MGVIAGQTAGDVSKTVLVDSIGRIIIATSSSNSLEYQTANTVATDTETSVLDFTNSSGSSVACNSIHATGTKNAEWFIYINDTIKMIQRTTASQMNLVIELYNFILANTDKITVKVKHYESGTADFQCTLNYEA